MKKSIFFVAIINFLFSFLSHFLYDWSPSTFTSIFFPVNESIFEHMKLIPTSIFITGIIECLFFKWKKKSYPNFLFSLWISGIFGILFYLSIYLPIYFLIGHSMFVSILLLFLTFIVTSIIQYFIIHKKVIPYQGTIGFFLIILEYVIFGYLSYQPLINPLFLDTEHNIYGIHTYEIK